MSLVTFYRIALSGEQDGYIGSSINLRSRWKKHRFDLSRGKHHCRGLQKAWREHGSAAFSFEILEAIECATTSDRAARELQWIIKHGTLNAMTEHIDTHNMASPSAAKRQLHSATAKSKIARDPEYAKTLARTGAAAAEYMKTAEARALMAEHTKRRWQDPKERERLGAGLKRRWETEGEREKHGAKIKAAHSTPEMRAMHSTNTKALWDSPEMRAKMEAGPVIRWSDPQQKINQSLKMKAYHARRRAEKDKP